MADYTLSGPRSDSAQNDGVNKAIRSARPHSPGQSQLRSRKALRAAPRQGYSSDNSSFDHRTSHSRARIARIDEKTQKEEEGKEEEEDRKFREEDSPGVKFLSPRAQKRKIIGFDNSDRNVNRHSLGSCTDRVADRRVKYGPWKSLDAEQLRSLTDRLAPYKSPHPPDPRFNTWVNHFEYYWQIGVDQKPTRRRGDRLSSSSASSNNTGSSKENYPVYGSSGVGQNNGRLYKTEYHRFLTKRPKTTPGRLMDAADSNGDVVNDNNDNNNNNSNGNNNKNNGPPYSARMYKHSNGSAMDAMTRIYTSRGRSDGTMDSSGTLPVISGLDRRYMGLQSVDSHQMKDIVGRLSRMTSAYHAKFAPNPHVWTDNSPGAHMVAKRENTIA